MKFGPIPKYPTVLNSTGSLLDTFTIIGGPCAVESPEQLDRIYSEINSYVTYFRGGVFRAGTYPPKEIGLKKDLLQEYSRISKKYNKPNIVEVIDIRDLEYIDQYAEVFQIGMRQGQGYVLLDELSRQKKPVILKRGSWMKFDEWMGALEYLIQNDKRNVMLMERGGVSYLDHVRWELSISMIAKISNEIKYPVIVDASHGTGDKTLVEKMTLAGIAAGASGFLCECHYDPEHSLSDAQQAISIEEFIKLANKVLR